MPPPANRDPVASVDPDPPDPPATPASPRPTAEPLGAAADGVPLRAWRWSAPAAGRATLLVVHGLGDHGRAQPYANLAAAAAASGHGLISLDQRGHGQVPRQQQGRTRLPVLVGDVQAAATALARQGQQPVLVGLSMGALVALQAALADDRAVRAVAAVAAPLGPVAASAATVVAARVLGWLCPGLVLASGIDEAAISDDPAALAAYLADPCFHRRVSAGLGRDLLEAPVQLRAQARRLTRPLLLMHGSADRIAGWDDRLANSVPPALGRVCLYAGGRHNLFLDRGRHQVFADLMAWLDTLPP